MSGAIILAAYLVFFALVHSILASLPFKRMVSCILRRSLDPWYTPAFGLLGAIMTIPIGLLLLIFRGRTLYVVPSPWRWLMVVLQAASGLLTVMAFIDAPHRFHVEKQLSGPGSSRLAPKGVYSTIRDPFLLSGLLQIWLTPFMTAGLLVTYVMVSIYLFLGSLHWESRLVAQFGDEYRDYMKRVPRAIPKAVTEAITKNHP